MQRRCPETSVANTNQVEGFNRVGGGKTHSQPLKEVQTAVAACGLQREL